MASILVTGANGQVGNEFRSIADSITTHTFLFVSRNELDINNKEAISNLFSSFKPDYCINCAAYTAVDKAETEWEAALATNATAVTNLAEACAQQGAKFIHISTDYVFDGAGTTPYVESDVTNPVNAYGKSKLLGEEGAVKADPETIIIRTSWVYSAYGNNFVKTMLRLMQSRPEISVVADQLGSPTYAADLAAAVMQIIESGKWVAGIYHFSNAGVINWHTFAQAIKELTHSATIVHPITTAQYPTPAKRPAYSVMNTQKIAITYGIVLKNWKESLQLCLQKIAAAEKVS